jgi:hypothetical protein
MKKFYSFLFALLLFCTLHAQDTTLKEYVGTYLFPQGSYVTSADVTFQDSVLTISSTEGTSPLQKSAKDTFVLTAYNGMAYFKRNSKGKVAGIKVTVEDILLEGTKEGVLARQPRKPIANQRPKAQAVR